MQVEQVPPNGTTGASAILDKPGLYVVRTLLTPNTKIRPRYFDQIVS